MDRNELEAEVLDMLEDICDDEAVREERDIYLFAARPPRSSARK